MTDNVLAFPTDVARTSPLRLSVVSDKPASVIIMPVVRIERHPDDPDSSPGRKRRRRNVSADICGNE